MQALVATFFAFAQPRLPKDYYWKKLDNGLEVVVIENIGLGILFAIEGWLWPPIKSAGKFQLDPLSNQRCLSQA